MASLGSQAAGAWQLPALDRSRHSRQHSICDTGRRLRSVVGPVTAVSDLYADAGQIAWTLRITSNTACHVGVVPNSFDAYDTAIVPDPGRPMDTGHYGIYSSAGQADQEGRCKSVRIRDGAKVSVVADMDGQTVHIWVDGELQFAGRWESPSDIPDGKLRLAVTTYRSGMVDVLDGEEDILKSLWEPVRNPVSVDAGSLGKRDSEGGSEEQPATKKPRNSSEELHPSALLANDDDVDLARAIQLSLEGTEALTASSSGRTCTSAESDISLKVRTSRPAVASAASAASAADTSAAATGSAAASAGPEEDTDSFTCPVCWDPVACAARPPCGHMLCRVCAQQLLRDGSARCPQCRAEVAEAELQGSSTADAAAVELAKKTLDADGLAEWKQRLADGKALDARAASAAAASSGGDGCADAKIDTEIRFMASAAPTDSSKCKVCAQNIARHDVRIHAHGGGFVHLSCMDFAGGLSAARDSAREKAGVPGAEVILNVMTIPEFYGPCGLSEDQLVAIKQKLREPAGNQPWWCVVRNKGPLWADELDDEDGLLSEDDLDDSESESDDDDDDDDEDDEDDAPPSATFNQLTNSGDSVRISTSLTISAAPTDRARCAGCGEVIPRGSPRLHEPTGTGFRHWHCRDFQAEWTSACCAARRADDGAVSLEVRSTIDPAGIGSLDRSMLQLLKQILRSTTEFVPPWVWVRHRGTLWSSNNGTPRAGILTGARAAAERTAGAVHQGAENSGAINTTTGQMLLQGLFGVESVNDDHQDGAAALGPAATAILREAIGAPVRQRAGRARSDEQGSGNDAGADEEDSSDEAAIAQAGHLGAALGGVLSLHEGDESHQIDEPEPWAKASVSYIASAAPSDRGKCKVCGQAIAQGSLVVAERQGGGHCHFSCRDYAKEVTDACIQARAGPCQERFVARPAGAAEDVGSSEEERQVALTIAVDIESRSDRISLVEDQIEVARKTLEDAADRQPWWVRTAYLRGSLWEGATSEAELSNLYSDDDEDSDTSSEEEEDIGSCSCDFCVATRITLGPGLGPGHPVCSRGHGS